MTSHARLCHGVVVVLLTIVLSGAPARAFEPSPTHPGLTARALLASKLHAMLTHAGWPQGLFQELRLDPSQMSRRDFNQLSRDIARLDPAGGYAPASSGLLRAVGWVMAGSVLAQRPASQGRNHFYCPPLHHGLRNATPLWGTFLGMLGVAEGSDTVRAFFTGTGFDLTGKAAPDWITDQDSPWTVQGFHDELARSVTAPTVGQRQHHLALALIHLGAVLHVLQDLASPTHVRNDFRVGHLQQLGRSTFNRGSVFERFVAEYHGQFGLPHYSGPPIQRARVRDYFTNARYTGLADITTINHFSPGTTPPSIQVLPETDPTELRQRLQRKLPLAMPALQPLDPACLCLHRARSRLGRSGSKQARHRCKARCEMKGQWGPVLAYTLDPEDHLRFFLDRSCHMTAARHLLPLAVGFSTGLVDHLIHARIALTQTEQEFELQNTGVELASARAQLIVESADNTRSRLRPLELTLPAATNATLARFTLPRLSTSARALLVLISGKDRRGDAVVAVVRWNTHGERGSPAPRAQQQ